MSLWARSLDRCRDWLAPAVGAMLVALLGLAPAGTLHSQDDLAARVLAALAPAPFQPPLLLIGGLLWAAAFGLFAVLYGSILARPRIDGKEG